MTETTMYWLTRLDAINSFFNGIGFVSFVIAFVGAIVCIVAFIVRQSNGRYNHENHIDRDYAEADNILKVVRPIAVWFAIICCVITIGQIFIPTSREMAAIKVVPLIASPKNCENIKSISNDVLSLAAEWLKDAKAKNKN